MSFSTARKRVSWPGYNPQSISNLVNKMVRDGEIVESFGGYKITNLGRRVIDEFIPVKKYAKDKWDGWWRLIVFDIPEVKR